MTSALECTCCTRGVKENAAIGLVVHQSAEISLINHMFRNTFPMRDLLNNINKPGRLGVRCMT